MLVGGRGKSRVTHLLVYLDGFLVFLQGGVVLGNLDQALVGTTARLLAFEVVSRDLIVLDDGLHVGHVVFEQLSDCLEHGNTGMEAG